jgi:uncharacterized iron-regulated membrane protein
MSLRTAVFWAHLACGVIAGAVILVMSVTGVILAFEPQIVAWAERDLRYVAPVAPGTPRLDLDAIVAIARRDRPDAEPVSIAAFAGPQAAVRVGFGPDDGAWVDPYRGVIVGTGSRVHEAMHVVTDWHRWLGARDVGRPITGACNVAFLGLALTGIYLWWPRAWRGAAVRSVVWFRRGLSGRARDFNWHNVIGAWSAPVLVVLTLTGVVMCYAWANDLLYRLAGDVPPPRAASPAPAASRLGARVVAAYQPLWERATAQVPSWSAVMLRMPARPGGAVTVFIREPASWGPVPRSQLQLDARTAAVVKWEPYAGASAGRTARAWVRYLHTGEAGGVAGQAVAGLASAGGVVLAWTGIALAWRRFRAWRARRRATRHLGAIATADTAVN